jgi:glycosyltransferase involved in cell wall biosynthesis
MSPSAEIMRSLVRATQVSHERGESEPDVTIVIPAYDEAVRIAGTLRNYCGHFGSRAAVVMVANGCRDETAEIVRSLRNE